MTTSLTPSQQVALTNLNNFHIEFDLVYTLQHTVEEILIHLPQVVDAWARDPDTVECRCDWCAIPWAEDGLAPAHNLHFCSNGCIEQFEAHRDQDEEQRETFLMNQQHESAPEVDAQEK